MSTALARAVLGICLTLAYACGGGATGKGDERAARHAPMPEPRTREFRACKSDSDCVYTHNGCCDCMNGGEDIAVRRDALAKFRAEFACEGQGCTEIGGDCGQGRVACEQGLCTYHAPQP